MVCFMLSNGWVLLVPLHANDHGLCHEYKLRIPGTVNLVPPCPSCTANSSFFITYSESDAISNIRMRVTNHGTVGRAMSPRHRSHL